MKVCFKTQSHMHVSEAKTFINTHRWELSALFIEHVQN